MDDVRAWQKRREELLRAIYFGDRPGAGPISNEHARDVVGPLMAWYWESRRAMERALDDLTDTADGDSSTAAKLRDLLRLGSPCPEVFDPKPRA